MLSKLIFLIFLLICFKYTFAQTDPKIKHELKSFEHSLSIKTVPIYDKLIITESNTMGIRYISPASGHSRYWIYRTICFLYSGIKPDIVSEKSQGGIAVQVTSSLDHKIKIKSTTDSNGYVSLNGLIPGDYTILIADYDLITFFPITIEKRTKMPFTCMSIFDDDNSSKMKCIQINTSETDTIYNYNLYGTVFKNNKNDIGIFVGNLPNDLVYWFGYDPKKDSIQITSFTDGMQITEFKNKLLELTNISGDIKKTNSGSRGTFNFDKVDNGNYSLILDNYEKKIVKSDAIGQSVLYVWNGNTFTKFKINIDFASYSTQIEFTLLPGL